ncbi:MAG: ABC transporter substrate-binding protein [Gammaproteobacteria bacterium]
MKNFTHKYAQLSLISVLIISLMTTIHHYYRFGFLTIILGLVVIGLPIALLFWFRSRKTSIALIGYGLASGWIIIGFGLIDGMWDSTLKLFVGNFLLSRYGQYFSWNPVGNFPFEATGVLASIASFFAIYYLYRFFQSALADLKEARNMQHTMWIPGIVILVLLLASGAFLSSRTISDGAVVTEDGVVKIGVIVPTTGPAALLGDSFVKAVQMAQENLKDTKYKYELVIENSSIRDPLQTKAAIQKLIKVDKVRAIVGGISASGEIVKPYTTAAKIPHICVCSILSIGDGTYNFTMISTPTADAAGWVTEAGRRNIKKIALLTLEYPSINGHVKALKVAAQKKGMTIVYEKRFDGATTDFRQMILEARATQPDVYFVESFNPALDVLGQQLRDAGVRNISSFVAPSLSAQPELFEGVWYIDTDLVDTEFRERFEAKYPDTQFATHMMPFAYDAFNLLVQGFESTEGAVKYIQNISEYNSAAGTVTKRTGSGTFQPTPAIWTIKDGKPALLYRN